MSIDLAGIRLRTPLIAAAGTCGYIEELPAVSDVSLYGALTTKSITVESREGNPPWRVIDVEWGMLNAIGLANVGLDRFLKNKLPKAADVDVVIIGSIAGGSVDDYVRVAEAFNASERLPLVELNVSCPNTSDGLEFGTDAIRLGELVREVRKVLTQTKMIVKLSPNVGDITKLAKTAIDAGADALTLINTMSAMAIDIETRKPRLSRGRGGLSGPAIHNIAVRMVHEVYNNVAKSANIPIIGLGGVMRWQDAAEMILAGATGVGIGTALFSDPMIARPILRGLRSWVERQRCTSVRELIGAAKPADVR